MHRPCFLFRFFPRAVIFTVLFKYRVFRLKLMFAALSFAYQEGGLLPLALAEKMAAKLRLWVKQEAKVRSANGEESLDELLREIRFLVKHAALLQPLFARLRSRRVLYSGQSYYHAWYLSRTLRKVGWKAVLLNWDLNPSSQIFYHGEDVLFTLETPYDLCRDLRFYTDALYSFDIYHFTNANGICFGFAVQSFFTNHFELYQDVRLLKSLGKPVVYTNNSCMDGVAQSSFAKWGPESICSICRWRNVPEVCSDRANLAWGALRNELADYQCLLGGNRIDYNAAPTVHEVPEVYCLNPQVWNPALAIPDAFRLPATDALRLYHAVGNRKDRTDEHGVNIKSSHVYGPLVEKLQAEGMQLELIEPTGIPNKDVRFLQMQADIFLDMLTYGWFGANAREAMMLGKPVICYIRPEWLESLRREIPEYAEELPIVSATPDTVEAVLRELIADPARREDIGRRGRQFAMKWHSDTTAAQRFSHIYTELLKGNRMLDEAYA